MATLRGDAGEQWRETEAVTPAAVSGQSLESECVLKAVLRGN